MSRVDEADFNKDGGTRGVLEYVKLVGLSDPAPGVMGESFAETLMNALRDGDRLFVLWKHPNFRAGSLGLPWRIVVGIRVQMDGNEQLAVMSIRDADSLGEQHIRIDLSRESDVEYVANVGFHQFLELKYDRKRDLFLPVGLIDSPGIFPAVSSVKCDVH